jgi:3-phosphoshikimate 1-carboxyvinyltransferase
MAPEPRTIRPARNIVGTVRLPGDKSISHRYAMLGAVAEGRTTIRGFSSAADCASTLGCLRGLGAAITRQGSDVAIEGAGLTGLRAPERMLDAGNSGSTIRMLSGILAGQPFLTRITGDESLERRPMGRVIEPLRQMGAQITAREGRYAPLEIRGSRLHGIHYRPPVASAQVKTAVLFAGLLAEGETVVEEDIKTRDHTELALAEFGADVQVAGNTARVRGGRALRGGEFRVPGDLSSAAFFIVAALLFPDSNLLLHNAGLNPTRARLLDFLAEWGADIRISNLQKLRGEVVGDLHVSGARPAGRGGCIGPELVPALIDELPVLAVLGAHTERGLSITGAQELRVKESDRIAAVADNLRRMGARVQERPDGLEVAGGQKLQGALLDSFGDHRIAMAFSVAALAAQGQSRMEGADAAQVSFPEFYDLLETVTDR